MFRLRNFDTHLRPFVRVSLRARARRRWARVRPKTNGTSVALSIPRLLRSTDATGVTDADAGTSGNATGRTGATNRCRVARDARASPDGRASGTERRHGPVARRNRHREGTGRILAARAERPLFVAAGQVQLCRDS